MPSQWLLVCSLFLTLFLGFMKRRSELMAVGSDFVIHRKALLQYNAPMLDKMIGVCAAGALMSYSLYTMSPATVRVHHTENLIYTIRSSPTAVPLPLPAACQARGRRHFARARERPAHGP